MNPQERRSTEEIAKIIVLKQPHASWEDKVNDIKQALDAERSVAEELRKENERLKKEYGVCQEDPAITGGCNKTVLEHKSDVIDDLQSRILYLEGALRKISTGNEPDHLKEVKAGYLMDIARSALSTPSDSWQTIKEVINVLEFYAVSDVTYYDEDGNEHNIGKSIANSALHLLHSKFGERS